MTDADLRALSQELKNAADAARRLAIEHSNLLSSSAKAQRDAEDYADTMQDAAKKTKHLTEQQRKLASDIEKLRKREREAINKVAKATKDLEQTIKQFGANSKEANEIQRQLNKAREEEVSSRNAIRKTSGDLDDSLKSSAKSAKIASITLDWFGTSLKNQGKELAAHYKAAGGVIEGSGGLLQSMASMQQDALKLGISGSELQETVNANRQVVNAMGGTSKAVEALNPSIDRLRILTGSSAAAAKMAAEQATQFASKGIKPSATALNNYTNDLVDMQRLTGKGYEEINRVFESVAKDSDSIAILRSARSDEREAILASQRALIKQSIAVGMSTEQAENAAKMLNKMAAAKPLDRLRQAAKIRALGGAMGVAGAEEAAQAVTAGKRMTDQQRANLNKFSQDMATTMDTMAGQGLGAEIFGSVLLDKLDLEQYYGSNSEFSKTLGTTMQPVVDTLKSIRDASTTTEGKLVGEMIKRLDQTVLLGSGVNMLGLAVSGLAASVATLAAVVGSGKMLNKLGGVGGVGASGGRGHMIKGGAKAGVVGAGMMLANQFVDEESTAGKIINSNTARGAGYGAMVGSVIPGIGTLVGGAVGGVIGGGMDAYEHFSAPSKGKTPIEMKSVSQKKQRELTAQTADDELKLATLTMADGVSKQIQQMDANNVFLKQLADNSSKQVELSEKQLIALTLSEKEKVDNTNRSNLRRDNKFAASYNYI